MSPGLLGMLVLATSLGSAAGSHPERAPTSGQRRIDQGIVVDFQSGSTADQPLQLDFRFSDSASGSALSGLRPAAWLKRRRDGDVRPLQCGATVAKYLSGDLFQRADVDLNSYFVLSLNDDASISVVDPLTGFGGSKLLARLPLRSPGADWALDDSVDRLFVSQPDAGLLAVADTRSWTVTQQIETGPNPGRLLLTPGQAWVSDAQGVTVINVETLQAQQLALGATGDLASNTDGDVVYASSGKSVLLIDAFARSLLAKVELPAVPSQLAWSSAAQALYVLYAEAGKIHVIDGLTRRLGASIKIRPGASQLSFAPGGRYALLPNPHANRVEILDTADNRIVHSAKIDAGPDRVSFSALQAYVRRRESATVLMIALDQLGSPGRLGVADFPAGQHAAGQGADSLADTLVAAPEGPAMLVANPADRMIYLYQEGMAAPAGGFSTYGRTPRAVLVVDQGLREQAVGHYRSSIPTPGAGSWDVLLFVNSPRVLACFELQLAPEQPVPVIQQTLVRTIDPPANLIAGQPVKLIFALSDPSSRTLRQAGDVRALAFAAPGIWQQRKSLAAQADGRYALDFTPPNAGLYYVWIESAALGLGRNNPQFQVFDVLDSSTH